MLGLFGLFGRAREIQTLDAAVREEGLHPRLVPDAVKMTVVRLVKGEGLDDVIPAAPLLAYAMLGPEDHAAAVGEARSAEARARLEKAIAAETSLDARLVLLCLEAGVLHPDVVADYDLERA
ncbi:hypothetical protein F1188_00570 [Roseospira marina]|uniref:Uncharacterized protein n=1 Tax=Roseospira marina TaxID=140057 RepID=A0A5M6IHN1_9PROT|nr:hypothetical protein [Roseospira marina]KAA5607299.1 hypothetical protein F1188_00570 [Roseospira marina]MBB4312544.1 hypothetical protein [Roseospira marina]MBB5085440.1 hypothetical protein [Roseospira marina]